MNANDFTVYSDIIKHIKSYFQGKIIQDSMFKISYTIPKITYCCSTDSVELERRSKLEIIDKLAKYIYYKKPNIIETEECSQYKKYYCEVIVLSTTEVKHLVEYTIKNLTSEQINKIRNNI